jgi:hypothetical protein
MGRRGVCGVDVLGAAGQLGAARCAVIELGAAARHRGAQNYPLRMVRVLEIWFVGMRKVDRSAYIIVTDAPG